MHVCVAHWTQPQALSAQSLLTQPQALSAQSLFTQPQALLVVEGLMLSSKSRTFSEKK